MAKIVELRAVRDSALDWDKLEVRIKAAFLKELYEPLMAQLVPPNAARAAVLNALGAGTPALLEAIARGTLVYEKGYFSGKLSAQVTRELKGLGAKWDRKNATFHLYPADLPHDLQAAISSATARFTERVLRLDTILAQFQPAEFAGSISMADLIGSSIGKADRDISRSLQAEALVVSPQLPEEQRAKIAEEWTLDLQRYITDFTTEETARLRKTVQDVVSSGGRRDALAKVIQQSYGTTQAKAKFLARQETGLMLAKMKETRYAAAGVNEYRWQCVVGSPLHPVRPSHKKLDGKVFRWDNPPITTDADEPERRNNPGQDYNCRCVARPIVRF